MSKDMIKKFISECLKEAKDEYFETDHHYYAGQAGKDAEWENLLKHMDRDFYDEWIDPVIYHEDEDFWFLADKFRLYMNVKEFVGA